MAVIGYAIISARSGIIGGSDGVVTNIGSVADLAADSIVVNPASLTATQVAIDTDDTNALNVDIGWHYVTPTDGSGEWRRYGLLTGPETVKEFALEFIAAVRREERDLSLLYAKELIAPHTDSGHRWVDDLLHALVKPHIRAISTSITALWNAGATNAATIAAVNAAVDSFVDIASDPGLVGVYDSADKSVWRPLRLGARAYPYDTDTGGIDTGRTDSAVTYPTGETVVTYDALNEIDRLEVHVNA